MLPARCKPPRLPGTRHGPNLPTGPAAGPAAVLATVDRMSGAIMLATGILLGLAIALLTAATITPIFKDRTRWPLLLLGCLLFLAVCLEICALA
jgi:hypothetical protein